MDTFKYKFLKIAFLIIFLMSISIANAQELYKVKTGEVKFLSDAPMELIKAESSRLTGLIKTSDKSFAFLVAMKTFEGFNSSLQRKHFNENYVESDKYPNAIFEGFIVEDIDFSKPGKYEVTGRGKFTVHGVEQVRSIKCSLTIDPKTIVVTSSFVVKLADHKIKIPKILNQKLSEEVKVDIVATLLPAK